MIHSQENNLSMKTESLIILMIDIEEKVLLTTYNKYAKNQQE